MSAATLVRVAVPTKDRSGSVGTALTCIGLQLEEGDELVLYDDGDRPSSADYLTRFALDMAMVRGANVIVKRGIPQGIGVARARMLEDAARDGVVYLVMVDDDAMLPAQTIPRLLNLFDDYPDAQYSCTVHALANNEAGVSRFGEVDEATSTHDQQFVLHGSGVRKIQGGAWTTTIALALERFDVLAAAKRLRAGPKVVEDYVLTHPLVGYVDRSLLVWHAMSPAQGLRDWDGKALAYLREQLSTSPVEQP